MVKTGVYLNEEQKRDLEQVVALTGRAQADLIRDGIHQVIQNHLVKRPPMKARFTSPAMAGRLDELMEGFGG